MCNFPIITVKQHKTELSSNNDIMLQKTTAIVDLSSIHTYTKRVISQSSRLNSTKQNSVTQLQRYNAAEANKDVRRAEEASAAHKTRPSKVRM